MINSTSLNEAHYNILDIRLYIPAGAHAPCNHAIGQESLIQFGTQVEGWDLSEPSFIFKYSSRFSSEEPGS
jgi:hypothetical protein